MKNIIIGTAGHIDHGKTTLIKALTGRNTDRWEEEQRRGITIDLGFTYFDLKSGDRVGIIDVPGHEKFINNMVAGVVGMDLVMLVVAADEGIMPQTREHMDILGELGIEKSILVLNKCDLVDEEWLELVEEEIQEELEGTFLENAPVVKVSAATGQGIPELIETIERLTADEVVEKDIHTIPRLPIDRVFSLSGFGTIITGTLLAGTICKEDTLQMYPIGKECKIRSIQVHGENVEKCYAGQRVAINISNLKKSEIHRGCVLAPPNNMKNTMLLDVKMNILPSSMRILTNHTRLHLFTGTSEILCRAVLLDKDEIGPGESGYVQLRLEEEIALRRGDKFIVRFYSPMETIGGGVVLEPNPTKKKRFHEETIEELKRKESGSTEDIIEMHIKNSKDTMLTVAELAKMTALSSDEVKQDAESLEERGIIKIFHMKKDSYTWHRENDKALQEDMAKTLQEYHRKHLYRYGMQKAEIHMTFLKKVKPNVFDLYLESLVEEGVMKRRNEFLSLPQHEIVKDEVYQKVESKLLTTFEKAGLDFPKVSEVDFGTVPFETVEDILLLLMEEKKIVKLGEELYTLTSYIEHSKEIICSMFKEKDLITMAEIRDALETSRKNAKLIVEYMDSIKITKRNGTESERVAY
ncbi:selenocysteine-specific translation elongation factor [Lachnospiraceae bacterium 2_1_46FAA]|nr:selenocysteine-specific translation elongation factor [Lachnospiraceae bacterium 2_1_46FAA]